MPFTDDDLKRLRGERIPHNNLEVHGDKIEALLARLEAGDRCAKELAEFYPKKSCVSKWRKAAGKDS